MESRSDISYGIVPVYHAPAGWEVLLVHQRSYRGDTFWIFPKGHAEKNETGAEAALRELAEETGITTVSILNNDPITIDYSFMHENMRIDKTVEYWIGACESKDTTITEPEEIQAVQWCTFAMAEVLLTHENSKNVLKKVQNSLIKH